MESNKKPDQWSVNEVEDWLLALGSPYKDYAGNFAENEIDGEALFGLLEKGGESLAKELMPITGT